ncbi:MULTISPECIES: dynamin family protein [unclassified Microcoleus]|uniref:dynamin family protein n=1 Tax=unclassified Microcoleus TaxID=2642155 RepID=UPI002FD0E555
MNINFRRYREPKGISQEAVASRLGISADQVRHYEQFPAKVPMGMAVKWLQILGVDIATAMSEEIHPLPGIEPRSPYAELYRRLNLLNQYIDENSFLSGLELQTDLPRPNDLQEQINQYYQKPNVVLTGAFDSGKSYLANTLLGKKILPTGYQPATRVITIVCHVESRPEWFDGNVGIIDEKFWQDENGKLNFNFLYLEDRERCQKHFLQFGSFDLLERYGVHQYDDSDDDSNDGGHTAIVYVDAPLLKACNLIDLPGYSDKQDEVSKDVEKAKSATQIANVLLYASPAKGHINGQDMERLRNLLRLLPAPENECKDFPTLGNFFIVATQADPSIPDDELPKILNKASARLYKELDETAIEFRRKLTKQDITKEDVQKRFFTFWSERPDRCQRLFDDLTQLLRETLPKTVICRVDREINAVKYDNKQEYANSIEQYQTTIAKIDEYRKELEKAEKNEPERQRQMWQKRSEVSKCINDLEKDTRKSFQTYAEKQIDVDSIEKMISQRYDKKKEAQEYAPGYLVDLLQTHVENRISVNSEKLKAEIDAFLEKYPVPKLPNKDGIVVSIPFDTKGAFLGGIAGLGAYGALAAWAASLGNLGGYILVGKLVSLLSALFGATTGGTAAVISFVSAIGGPIVLGIGLAAGFASLVWNLFGEAWQKRLAKEIHKHLTKQGVVNKFLAGIDQYWQETATAFDQGADAVEAKCKQYLKHLHEITSTDTQSKERIEQIIINLEKLRVFFANIPWDTQGECL